MDIVLAPKKYRSISFIDRECIELPFCFHWIWIVGNSYANKGMTNYLAMLCCRRNTFRLEKEKQKTFKRFCYVSCKNVKRHMVPFESHMFKICIMYNQTHCRHDVNWINKIVQQRIGECGEFIVSLRTDNLLNINEPSQTHSSLNCRELILIPLFEFKPNDWNQYRQPG